MNWTERLFVARPGTLEKPCAFCGKAMYLPPSQANQRSVCDRACKSALSVQIAERGPTPSWDVRLHEDRPGTVALACRQCSGRFWVPPSKVADRKTCGPMCAEAFASAARQDRVRACDTCGAAFSPRLGQLTRGQGRFCSQACNTAGIEAVTRPEVLARAQSRARELRAAGLIVSPRGAANKRWAGGTAACRARRRDSGKAAETLRRYRAANPHKVREFRLRRKGRAFGRLPRGTVQRIGDAQRWKCAICAVGIKRGFHLDHIEPLARGGEHAPRNLQLLCKGCNVRKSAKDPMDYMRQIGRLL